MGLKSGIHTSGAQHLASLVNSAEGIKKLIPEWDIHETAANATEAWFEKQLGQPVDTKLLIDSLEAGEGFGEEHLLSLAQ